MNIEPERILFDTIVEFINQGDKSTQTLLKEVRIYLKNNANMDLKKKYRPFQTNGFNITDVFIQYTPDNYGALPEHDISILEMMTPEGTIWQNDKDKNKKHFFGLLKLLFGHGARSINHIGLQSEVPYLIFMALISPKHDTSVFNQNEESVLENFLEVFTQQKVKRENKTFIGHILNDVYEGNERLISIDTSEYIIKNFVVRKGYTLLHILIECGYSHYQHIILFLLNRFGGNQILIDYNKNNPFYLALEVYKRENNLVLFTYLLKPYLELIGKGLKINNYYFDEDFTTFMKLLEVYHEERINIIKNQLSAFIEIIMEENHLKPTRKDKISPLLYFLNLDKKLYYYTHIEERKSSYNNNVTKEKIHVQFEGTVKIFHLFMKLRSEELFKVSNNKLSAFLYVLNLNLDHVSKNKEYNQLIDILKHYIDRRNKATKCFIDYYIIKEKQTRIDYDDLIDGIRINDKQIVKNLVQFKLFDVRGTQLDFKESKIDLKKIKKLPYEEQFQKQILLRKEELQEKLKGKIPLLVSLIQLGIPALKLLGNDIIILLVQELESDSYNLLYSVVEQDQNNIYKPIIVHEIPLKIYIQSVISNYRKKLEKLNYEIYERNKYEYVDYSSPIEKEVRRISKIFFNLEYLWKKRYITNQFEDYLYHYHSQYKQIKDTLIKYFKNKNFEDPELIAINFMTENGIEPEYAVKDEDEYEFNLLYPDGPPPYPYNVISQWKDDYTFLWYPAELTDQDCENLFNQLKLEEEDVKMREMNDYYLTGSEMAKRFEDI